MKKTVFMILALAGITASVVAQTVEDGIKFLYYEKNKSAKETLQKVVDKKPKDALAIYWLGQAFIADKDVKGAQALYEKALADGINDPYIWIGSAQVQLLEGGDINSAKQKFEQAITATKGKRGAENADILNAIGRANATGGSKIGDPNYAIEVLKRAQQIDKKNPDIDINLGINYLKLGSEKGGDAVEALRDATVRDPKYAKAYAMIGNVYRSQDNKPSMDEWFVKAIDADHEYGPVYLSYFYYYQERDVNAAKEYLDKYIARADKDCNTNYFEADYLFRAGKYQESIAKADSMAAGECKDFPRLGILYAYNYSRLGDSDKAEKHIEQFLKAVPASEIEPDDYVLAANVFGKVQGMEDSALTYYQKAMDVDTVAKNKVKYIDSIASLYKKINKPQERLVWQKKSYHFNPAPSNRDIYDLADAAFNADSLQLADSMYTLYKEKYPDQVYGYLGRMKIAQKEDSTGAKAVEPINEYIGFLMNDTTKNGPTIAYYHALNGTYYANEAKNFDSSIHEFELAARYDPANAQYQQILNQLTAAKKQSEQQKNAPQKAPATKPKTGAGAKK